MNVLIKSSVLKGSVKIPPSKSIAHRAIICAALADGESYLQNIQYSQDILATLEAISALGAKVTREENAVKIIGVNKPMQRAHIDCNESGSTLRFLIPIVAALGIETSFFGQGRLPDRPLTPYQQIFANNTVHFTQSEQEICSVKGKLSPGCFMVDGTISSQFITGLLFSLPLLSEDSKLIIHGTLESAPYVAITIDVLKSFGVQVVRQKDGFLVQGNQTFKATNYYIEGDYSQAAFFAVYGACFSPITLTGLKKNTSQGDQKILDYLHQVGAYIEWKEETVRISKDKLNSFTYNIADTPDLAPPLALLALCCSGKSLLTGAGRLRLKESDRIASIAECVKQLGAKAIVRETALEIEGTSRLNGGSINSFADHRIVMMAAIAGCQCMNDLVIQNAEAVKKSYPAFFTDYKRLGGRVYELNVE